MPIVWTSGKHRIQFYAQFYFPLTNLKQPFNDVSADLIEIYVSSNISCLLRNGVVVAVSVKSETANGMCDT